MSALLNGYITLEKLKDIVKTVEAKKAKGFGFTMSINNESNDYGQNASLFAEQTKEQREVKAKKWYFGNAKVVWTDGTIVKGEKKEGAPVEDNTPTDFDSIPF